MSDKTETVTFNATVFWANLTTKNDLSGKYQLDLGMLSDKAVEALENLGLGANHFVDEENPEKTKENYITCKSNNPIRAYDKESGDEIGAMGLGNGTKVTCVVKPYSWKFKSKSGCSPSLLRMVVKELVEFEGSADTEYDMDEAL